MNTEQSTVLYRERALTCAASLAALATARLDGRTSLRALEPRQNLQIEELLHDFAFVARKFLEQADRQDLGLIAQAKVPAQFSSADLESFDPNDPPRGVRLSFWEAIGRIIHSEHLIVDRRALWVPPSYPPVFQEMAWAFAVRSDKDAKEQDNFIFMEFFLEEFLRLDGVYQEEAAKAARRSPAAG